MRTAEVQSLVGRVAGVASDCSDCSLLQAGVSDLRRLKSWVEGREVDFALRIAEVSSFPEKSLAEAANTSVREGGRLLQRAETAAVMPEFGVSLNDGHVSGEHLDVLTRVLRGVTPAVSDQLAADGVRLVRLAQHSTPDEFARTVREAARVLEAASDGLDKLERHRRAMRCVSWIDTTGMGRIMLTLDPLTYATLEQRLDAQVETMFHDTHPDGCPVNLLEKQSFLRAHALLSLLQGTGSGAG